MTDCPLDQFLVLLLRNEESTTHWGIKIETDIKQIDFSTRTQLLSLAVNCRVFAAGHLKRTAMTDLYFWHF
jgi:hypothetical protein